jgi:hypothetical protein
MLYRGWAAALAANPEMPLDELEGQAYSRLRSSDDFREGVAAFHAKRKPNFGGSRGRPRFLKKTNSPSPGSGDPRRTAKLRSVASCS